jgi:hypothetical protein
MKVDADQVSVPELAVEDKLQVATRGGIPFAQYQLFYESAERVTDRRLTLNRTNASLAIFIAAGIGLVVAWAFDKPDLRPVALLVSSFLSVLAALFCRWWWKQIEDYKALNSWKFKVLAAMSKNLISGDASQNRHSFDPFFWEWEIGKSDKQILRNFGTSKALGSTFSELVVPKAFLVFFISTAVSTLAYSVWDLVQPLMIQF